MDQLRTLTWQDYSAGWCPSDDSVNGRKNALLKMENVELDQNGALSLAGGCAKVGSSYGTNIHSLFSDDIGGARVEYAGGFDGHIYRNRTSIASSGDTLIAAFSTAFKYSLLCSGATRLKDVGSGTPVNLGVGNPSAGPTVTTNIVHYSQSVNSVSSAVAVQGSITLSYGPWKSIFDSTSGAQTLIVQSNAVSGAPFDYNNVGGAGSGTDEDFIAFLISMNASLANSIDLFQLDFLLVAPGGSGSQVSDYYTITWINDGTYNGSSLQVQLKRGDFTRIGATQNLSWSNVYGIRLTVKTNSACSFTWVGDGSTNNQQFQGGILGSLQGTYEYAQVNVNNTGSYLAKSIMGPITTTARALDMESNHVTPQDPSGVDAQVTEVWIFRRGGNLPQWYRVAVLTSYGAWADNVQDQDALTLGITWNTNLISVQSIPKIYSICGPVEGRWFYFTGDICYPSDLNNPDLVDPTIGIRCANTNSEVFLWAFKIGDGTIMYGTSHDIYIITGTFATLPDFTIDIYNRSLGCKHPPICYDASYNAGTVYYLAVDGWRSFTAVGQTTNLCTPNTDKLYRKGDTAYGYTGPAAVVPGSTRFPCVLANNKLYCGITGQARIEVYDLGRNYWRVITYGKGDITAICSCPDGSVTGTFSSDNFQRDISLRTSLLVDGSAGQAVVILSPVFDDGLPSNRKDTFTVKARLKTGSTETLVSYIVDDAGTPNLASNFTNSASPITTEQIADVPLILKTIQFALTGTFTQFILDSLYVDYIARPTPLTRLYIRPDNFGKSNFKLLSAWPFMIDTLGNNVTFSPKIDGQASTPTVFSTTLNRKQTINHLFTSHLYGIDFEGLFTGGPFEFYGMLNPVVLDINFPVATIIYQAGPVELFKYGKIKQFEIRASSTVNIGYIIMANDTVILQSIITVDPSTLGKDACYYIPVPKGIEGQVLKILLYAANSSTAISFFYARILVSQSGQDTDNKWITLPVEQQG